MPHLGNMWCPMSNGCGAPHINACQLCQLGTLRKKSNCLTRPQKKCKDARVCWSSRNTLVFICIHACLCAYVWVNALSGICTVHWMTSRPRWSWFLCPEPAAWTSLRALDLQKLLEEGRSFCLPLLFHRACGRWEIDYRWLYIFQVSLGFPGRGRATQVE